MSRRSDPRSLLENPRRFLSEAQCRVLAERIRAFANGGGETAVSIDSWWAGDLRWALNRVSLAGDRRESTVNVRRTLEGAVGVVITNQLDEESLAAAVRAAQQNARLRPTVPPDPLDPPDPPPRYSAPPHAEIWSDATVELDASRRVTVAQAAIGPAESAGMLSAGYLEVRGQSQAFFDARGALRYAASTEAQCSVTVRDPRGTGSGWAGASSHDWAKINPQTLSRRALDKCLASRNPVALEPGRYTVVLEPQAVHDLVSVVVYWLNEREQAEAGHGPFAMPENNSKLGLKVVDSRITISHDPSDPELGVVPFVMGTGEPIGPVTWVDHGVLTALGYDRDYALRLLNENDGRPRRSAYRMGGGEVQLEEMIKTTKRGLLVTRFSNTRVLDRTSLLMTGLTRDGLWLIENGVITKAVKNFRFTESPLFVLNSVEQLGTPETPVFSPGAPAIVPALKARDFSFTSLIDAI